MIRDATFLNILKALLTLQDILGPGTAREFIVLDVPDEGAGKNEVLLSARSLDFSILWERMQQMKDISTEVRGVHLHYIYYISNYAVN